MAKNLISGDTTTINENGNDIAVELNQEYVDFIDKDESLQTTAQTLPSAINENKGRLDDLMYVEEVVLASNISIPSMSNYGSGSINTTITPKTGYVPILVTWQNNFNYTVNLWYLNLTSNTNIRWRAGNPTSAAANNITIQVRVLYIKEDCYLGKF